MCFYFDIFYNDFIHKIARWSCRNGTQQNKQNKIKHNFWTSTKHPKPAETYSIYLFLIILSMFHLCMHIVENCLPISIDVVCLISIHWIMCLYIYLSIHQSIYLSSWLAEYLSIFNETVLSYIACWENFVAEDVYHIYPLPVVCFEWRRRKTHPNLVVYFYLCLSREENQILKVIAIGKITSRELCQSYLVAIQLK